MDSKLQYKGRAKTFQHQFAGTGVPKKAASTLVCFAGQIGTLTTNATTGAIEGVLADGATTALRPVGILGETRTTTAMFKVASQESQTFVAGTNFVVLAHANIVANTILVTDSTGLITRTGYTINTTNGVLTRTSGGDVTSTATVLVSYQYVDVTDPAYGRGIDEIGDSRMVTYWIDRGEYKTLIYNIQDNIQINNQLTVGTGSLAGVIVLMTTARSVAGYPVVGYCTKPPTPSDPWLTFKSSL